MKFIAFASAWTLSEALLIHDAGGRTGTKVFSQDNVSLGPIAYAYQGPPGSAGHWASFHLPAAGIGAHLGHPGELHSQVGQDWLVQSILQCPSHGFFLELASAYPEHFSNSLMLERDFNWKGLCVDANSQYANQYAMRKCQYVVAAVGSPTDKEVEFEVGASQGAMFGGIVGPGMDNKVERHARKMKLVALADLLRHFKAPHVIDYFSLDVEGAESLVMQGFPWSEFKFKVMTIERPKPDLEAALARNGYERLRKNSNFGDYTWINTRLLQQNIGQVRGDFRHGAPWSTCMTKHGYSRPLAVVR